MRDLGITVLVALLIVLAGIRFSGYQSQLALESEVPLETDSAAVIDSTIPAGTTTVEPASPATQPAQTGAAALVVGDQKAGGSVTISSVTVPEGSYWVAVHEGARTLGARLFVKGQATGAAIPLLRQTTAGMSYTVSLRRDNGDGDYNRTLDLEVKDIAGKPIQATFNAN